MKALVTGATGFVGAAVTRALLAAHWQVRVLVRKQSDRRNIDNLDVEVAEGGLDDSAALACAAQDCAALFHVAADYRLGAPDPSQLYRTNVDGTRNVLDAAKRAGVQRIVYTSSVATIGIPGDGTAGDESTPAALQDMIGHYKRSKYLAEEAVRTAARAGNPVIIVSPSTPVGPGDVKPTSPARLVLDAAAGRMPAYVDTGLNIVHVDDVAAGHLLAFERGRVGERYILGGQDMSLREILQLIASLVGRKPPRLRLPYGAVLPIAYLAEGYARLSGRSGRITLEGVRMSRQAHVAFQAPRRCVNWATNRGRRSKPSKMPFAGSANRGCSNMMNGMNALPVDSDALIFVDDADPQHRPSKQDVMFTQGRGVLHRAFSLLIFNMRERRVADPAACCLKAAVAIVLVATAVAAILAAMRLWRPPPSAVCHEELGN